MQTPAAKVAKNRFRPQTLPTLPADTLHPDASLRRWSPSRLLFSIAGGILLWAIVAALCACIGPIEGFGWPQAGYARSFRLESVLVASLVGASLAAAGVVYQAILRNPLADPYLLGVSGGASLCAYAWRLPLAGALAGSFLVAMSQQVAAFSGAMIVVAIVLLLATRRGRLEPVTLLLVGVVLNSIDGALFLLLDALHPEIAGGTGGAMGFLVGGLQSNLTRGQEVGSLVIAAAGWVVLLYAAGELNVAALHESEAEALGVRIQRLRWTGLIVASVVTAAAVAISGPIGFIGLICPHLARAIFGADHRRLLPWSTALGAALLCSADAISRLLARRELFSHPMPGTHLPVGVLTAMLGGPFFLVLLWQRRGGNEE
ncbi:MAG TPA: iron ABC transporter permease [Tepidisphaeraceae bacterium]|jgi:iron complex transport system permease protein|nr:iron ABC transporter permease [Tepidisphaeraceae bacterium]